MEMEEMEEVFLQLCGELARLQELCSEQGRLLQRLRARKGPALDTPELLLPIQCTEDVVTGDRQRSPESHQNPPGALPSSTSHLEQPLEQPQATRGFLLSPGGGAGTGAAAAFGDVPTWMRTWTLPTPWEGAGAPCSPQELGMLNPGAGGSFPNPLDLHEAPEVLEEEDAPRDVALPGEALVEIRGPVKTCWTPGWALQEEEEEEEKDDEELRTRPGCGAAPGCDLCQEISPLDAAGHLSHVLPHLQ